MFRYFSFHVEAASDEDEPYRAFGLRAERVLADGADCAAAVADVSTDPGLVSRLAELFTCEQLDPIHLIDVLQDIL